MKLDVAKIYKEASALLEGHFLLSSGNHSKFYLQSAKVLENPKTAEVLAKALAEMIKENGIKADTVCSPALGGVLAGYELAKALKVRSIFVERENGEMTLRRGFEISEGEKVIICEDIITTGGSAMEAFEVVKSMGGEVVAFAALANRGFCKRVGSDLSLKPNCKLDQNIPFFALEDFVFDIFSPDNCPLCVGGDAPIKPGSRSKN